MSETGGAHRVQTVDGQEIEVLTMTDLELLLGQQAQRLLRWILGTGLFLAVSATLMYASMEHRIANTESRNATDSLLLSDLTHTGSEPVRALARDLSGLREEIADLKLVIRDLQSSLIAVRRSR